MAKVFYNFKAQAEPMKSKAPIKKCVKKISLTGDFFIF